MKMCAVGSKGFLLALVFLAPLQVANGQAQGESPVFFREDWAETPPALPITQDHVESPDLTLHLYGPGGDQVKKSHHEEPPLDPYYVWSGECEGTWAVTLSREGMLVDLSGAGARIRWRSRPSGLRQIHAVLRQADGTWLVSEQADTLRGTWHDHSFRVQELQWRRLDIERVTEGERVQDPDLSRIAEVGFTDLMPGGGSAASTRIGWIEVRGAEVTAPTPNDHLLTFKQNGGWCWFQDERAIVDDETLVFGTVAGTTRAGHDGGDIDVTAYEIDAGASTTVELHDQLGQDDHNVPSLLRRPDGRYLAAYSTHGADSFFRYRLAEWAGEIGTWSDEHALELPGEGVTYTNLHFLASANGDRGRIYNFSRAKGIDPNWMYSDDGGQAWTWGGRMLDWPGRPYVKYASDGQAVIHLATTDGHPRDFDNNIYHGYIKEDTLHDSHGTVAQALHDGPLTRKALTKVFSGDPHNVAWTTDLHLDADGHPVMGFSVQKDGASFKNNPEEGPGWDHRYYYARFDGTEWHVHEMAYAGTGLYPREADYTGLLAIDPNEPSVVYISSDVHPQTGLPNVSETDEKRHYEIFKGVTDDGGASWTWTPVTTDSDADHLRPVIPSWEGPRRAVLWQRGDFRTYTDYDTNIVGIIEER